MQNQSFNSNSGCHLPPPLSEIDKIVGSSIAYGGYPGAVVLAPSFFWESAF